MKPKNNIFLSLKIDYVLANNEDPYEMPRVACHQGPHCLPKYLFRSSVWGFWSSKGY